MMPAHNHPYLRRLSQLSHDTDDDITPEGGRLLNESNSLLAQSDEMKWTIGRSLDILQELNQAEGTGLSMS
jgi:hypothetical protein